VSVPPRRPGDAGMWHASVPLRYRES
jgi:hypothetical protein